MQPSSNSPYLLLLLPLLLFTAACDGLVGDGDEAAPSLVGAEVVLDGQRIEARFSEPLDEASVTASAFRIGSSLDNGRGFRGTATLAVLLSDNTVLVTVPGSGLGNGRHTLTATGIRSAGGGAAGETSITFEFRR